MRAPSMKEMAMAIELECVSVIVRIRAIEERYPGGLTAYRDDCPNNSYLQDDHLTRVGFMSTAEADQYLGEVAAEGLRVTNDPSTSDALMVCNSREPIARCDWLVIGEHDGVTACWLNGSPPGQLVRWHGNPRSIDAPAGPEENCPGSSERQVSPVALRGVERRGSSASAEVIGSRFKSSGATTPMRTGSFSWPHSMGGLPEPRTMRT